MICTGGCRIAVKLAVVCGVSCLGVALEGVLVVWCYTSHIVTYAVAKLAASVSLVISWCFLERLPL